MKRSIEELRAIAITMNKTLDQFEYEMLSDLMNEYNELEERIDKAIEYIEHFSCDEVCENLTIVAKILKEILKGDNND